MTCTTEIDLVARGSGRDYRLLLWVPPVPAPRDGFPVLWVLDGSGYHGLAVDMVRNRGVIASEIEAAVVVSVTYPSDDIARWMSRRFHDFTPTDPPDGAGRPGLQLGGLDAFLDMIEADALPAVQAHCAIDRARMALFGHSMGGLAVLQTLFTRPALFQSWLAISPSIHWNGRELLQHEAGFTRALQRGPTLSPRLFIGVGGLEQTPLAALPPGVVEGPGVSLAAINAAIAAQRCVDDAAELAARLQSLPGTSGLRVRYACPPDETHMSVPFALLRPALDLALPRTAT